MASASSLAGNVTVPKLVPAETFRLPPVPTYSRAPVNFRDSKSPVMTAPEVPIDGSITVESVLRVISTVALPKTTWAMLNPTEPLMRKVGSVVPRPTPVSARAV